MAPFLWVSGSRTLQSLVNRRLHFLNRLFDQLIKLTLIFFSPLLSDPGRNEFMGGGVIFIKFRLAYYFCT